MIFIDCPSMNLVGADVRRLKLFFYGNDASLLNVGLNWLGGRGATRPAALTQSMNHLRHFFQVFDESGHLGMARFLIWSAEN